MPVRRTIGISLACLVTSACAFSKTPEESTFRCPGQATDVPQKNAEMPTDRSPGLTCEAAQEHRSADYGPERAERRFAGDEPPAYACSDVSLSDPCCSAARTAGSSQVGKAAWYDLLGNKTASGEILDAVTATAAHRSLPLASFAKVTNLDNGRSVIVKINDRGPYTRGRILDLSPRAADALDMKRVGVASVLVEPLLNQMAPTVAVFRTSVAAVAQ
jgi:rare lipoprotein A